MRAPRFVARPCACLLDRDPREEARGALVKVPGSCCWLAAPYALCADVITNASLVRCASISGSRKRSTVVPFFLNKSWIRLRPYDSTTTISPPLRKQTVDKTLKLSFSFFDSNAQSHSPIWHSGKNETLFQGTQETLSKISL